MLKKIVLFGAGGFGREVAASVVRLINEKCPTYDLLGFLDDSSQYKAGDMIDGVPWLGDHEWIVEHKEDVLCTCTIGDTEIRSRIQQSLAERGVRFETLICPDVFIGTGTEIGAGCVLYGGVAISIHCKIGDGVLMNDGVKIGHDATVGAFTSIMPDTGISGNCRIGEGVNIGGHAYIVPGRKVGDKATIAAGSIVFSNVKSGTTVLGNPAKRMRGLE